MAQRDEDLPPPESGTAGPGGAAPGAGPARSVWADLVMAAAGDDEPEEAGPRGTGAGTPSPAPGPSGGRWPASGLPPSFGRQAPPSGGEPVAGRHEAGQLTPRAPAPPVPAPGPQPGPPPPGPWQPAGWGAARPAGPMGEVPAGQALDVEDAGALPPDSGLAPDGGPAPDSGLAPDGGTLRAEWPAPPAGAETGERDDPGALQASRGYAARTGARDGSGGWQAEQERLHLDAFSGRAALSHPARPPASGPALAPPGHRPPSAVPPPRAGAPPAGSAESLTADFLLPGRHAAPAAGWRRRLYQISGGLVRAPQSAAERRRDELVVRARTPVAGGHHRVAVLSLKGGVGKTTTVMGLGATLASVRGDRVIAVDANPDRGTLSDKLRLETAATVRDLLNEREHIHRYADVRAYTTQAASRLEVLASDRDPTVSVAFGAQDYEDVARVLENFYSICVTDCGTGLLHSAMAGVLRLAGQIVVVSSPSVDGARSASATLDWLAAHNYGGLVRGCVVVLSAVRPRGKTTVDLSRLEEHFAARCRAVVRVPYDAHLAEGAEIDLSQLAKATADAYLALAAEVGDGFAVGTYRADVGA